MTNDDLRKLLSLGENGSIERKANYNREIFGKNICAFLNSKGGYLICIPKENICKKTISEIQDEISQRLLPEIMPHSPVFVNVAEIENQSILVIEIPEGQDKPYAFNGAFYLREGNAVRTASVDEIKDMLLKNQIAPTRWERMFSDEITMEDLSSEELKRLFYKMPYGNDLTLQRHLEKLSLFRQGRLTNAADILFTSNPAIRHPQTRVRAVCYTQKTASKYQDIKKFEGPVIQLIEDILKFIERNTASQAVFSENSAQRQMIPQYPTNAIREGLINAFAHRDYASYGGGIRVEISPEKLTIWNSGSLPEGVSLTSLQKGQISVLRNPDIANYLHLHGYMEMLGRGSVLIQEECKKAHLPVPEWQADEAGVTLTFFAADTPSKVSRPESGPMIEQAGPELGPMTGPELFAAYQAELTSTSKMDGVMKVLTIGDMSKSEMAEALHLKSVSGALKRAVEKLEKKFHFIEKIDPDKTTSRNQKYRLTAIGKKFLEDNYQ